DQYLHICEVIDTVWRTQPAAPTVGHPGATTRRMRHAIVLVALLAVAACAGDDDPDAEPPSTEPSPSAPPGTTQPAVAEPATTEPVATEPIATEPIATEPVTTEPVTTEPAPPVRDFSEVDAIVGDFVAERGLNGAGLIVVDGQDGVVHEQ